MDGVQSVETGGVSDGGRKTLNQFGKLCNSDLMGHKKVSQGVYGEVCICKGVKKQLARRAYCCRISWYPSCSP